MSEGVEGAGEGLTYPSEDWSGFVRNHLGPSVVWALLGIGTSHVVLAPTVGARYGLFGVWLYALVYLVKWGGWELGVRYSYGRGKNPVEGYENLPGPDRWGQWFTFGVYLLLWTNIHGAVTATAASFADAIARTTVGVSLGIVPWYVLITVPVAALVYFSRYQSLENVLKASVVLLGGVILLAVFVAPPDAATVAETAFAVPDVTSPVFIALFAGLAAYTPIGLSSSVSIGSWSMAKGQGARELDERGLDADDHRGYVGAWMRTGLRDFNTAYVLSFLLAASTVALSASTLYGTGRVPSGEDVPLAVGRLLQNAYGEWAFYVMLAGAGVAVLSTVVSNMDAVARVCSDTLGIVGATDDVERWRRALVVFIAVFSIAPVLAIGSFPVVLITFSAALVGVFQVFFYVANYYLVRTELPDEFQPSRARVAYYALGMLLVALFGVAGALNNFGIVNP